MIGFPKILKTGTDFINCHKMAMDGKLSKTRMKIQWESLLYKPESPHSRLNRLGFSLEEVNQKIAELGV